MEQADREKHIHQIRIAEQLEHWDIMWKFLTELAPNLGDTEEEKCYPSLISTCVVHRIGELRTAHERVERKVQLHHAKSSSRPHFAISSEGDDLAKQYLKHLFDIARERVDESVSVVKSVEANAPDAESKCIYDRIIADCYRYLCEISDEASHAEMVAKAESAYFKARDSANELPNGSAVRLQTKNNFAVFMYEQQSKKHEAFILCEKEFEEAKDNIRPNADAIMPLQLLRDNLTCWQNGDEQPRFEQASK
eukprot:GHVH01010794.1.p1 GENE.GHVH01010794.1~~GHVH01010794.1.p1  ORF type:complete len:251 (+),score=37.06 GHVH01010794.1:103-855(+)